MRLKRRPFAVCLFTLVVCGVLVAHWLSSPKVVFVRLLFSVVLVAVLAVVEEFEF